MIVLTLSSLLALFVSETQFGARNRPSAVSAGNQVTKVLSTSAPQQPSESEIVAEEAPPIEPPVGVTYLEQLPDFPPAPQSTSVPGFSRPHRPTLRSSLRNLAQGQQFVQVGSQNVTGINKWWLFQEGHIGGVGQFMVNIGSGNLLLQTDDMVVPHKGLELAFRRTYNSFSQHDYNNSDGSVVDNYGDGWTNNFDAHIAANDLSNGSGISVFDGDGARYDYRYDCSSTCAYVISSPLGQYASLAFDPTSGWFTWTKKSGTIYLFHSLTDPAVPGRIAEIWGRNQRNKLTFTYSFDGGATPGPTSLNNIIVQTEATSGRTLSATLKFADYLVSPLNPTPHRLLISLTWPDQTLIEYHYDTDGRLIQVDEPSNNATTPSLPIVYQYASTGHLVTQASGARWILSLNQDGGYVQFSYVNDEVTSAQYYGFINPNISDGTSSQPLQQTRPANYGTISGSPYRTVTYGYGQSTPLPAPAPSPVGSAACAGSQSVPWYDSDGREVLYCVDSLGRVVQADSWSGGQWLTTRSIWDSNNNLVSTIDANGNETDYAYDTRGNTIAVALPAPSPSGARPTTLYSYDSHDNVTAVCDAIAVNASGMDWTSTPAPNQTYCSTTYIHAPFATYSYTPTTREPDGELTEITSPMGYHYMISYSTATQGGTIDYGLPTTVQGDIFTQNDSKQTQVQPTQSFVYDSYGRLECYNKGNGWSVLAYDGKMGRVAAVADPDDASPSMQACSKVPGLANSTILTTTTYYQDGAIATTQTPTEAAAGVSTSFSYDYDGNEVSETHHFDSASTSGTTQKWYDADERLVEVLKPYDNRSIADASPTPLPIDVYPQPWMMRYDYDLSQNGIVSMSGSAPYSAHGYLYKTQEYFGSPEAWYDIGGASHDSAGRVVATYAYNPNDGSLHSDDRTYDASGQLGLLSSYTDALGNSTTYGYDYDNRVTGSVWPSTNPTLTFSYDLDGRKTSIYSSEAPYGVLGGSAIGTEMYTYDAEGRITCASEPTGAGATSPDSLAYGYYPNGWKSSVSVYSGQACPSPQPSNPPTWLTYQYRPDGRRSGLVLTYDGTAYNFGWTYTSAGREETSTDPQYTTLAHQYSYDSFGRVAGYAIPAGTYTNLTYDPEGEIKGYVGFGNPSLNHDSVQVNNQYSLRGEFVSSYPTDIVTGNRISGASARLAANGYMDSLASVCQPPPNQNVCGWQSTDLYDPKNGVRTQQDTEMGIHGVDQCLVWQFDSDRRFVGTFKGDCFGTPPPTIDTRTYDNSSHVVSTTNSLYSIMADYVWGPNGHPALIGSSPPGQPNGAHIKFDTLHWDGDTLLYTTNSLGQIDDIKIEDLADLTPLDKSFTGLTMWDRDLSGLVASVHNSSAPYGPWTNPDVYHRNQCSFSCGGPAGFVAPSSFSGWVGAGIGQNAPPITVGQGGILAESGSDGIGDYFSIIQGNRAYDASLQSWTTPDAFQGVPTDPANQKQFMYDGNNPVVYDDPSGFYEETVDSGVTSQQQQGFDQAAARAALEAQAQAQLAFMAAANSGDFRYGGNLDPLGSIRTIWGDTALRMQQLAYDLTKGTPGWNVELKPLGPGDQAEPQTLGDGSILSSDGSIKVTAANTTSTLHYASDGYVRFTDVGSTFYMNRFDGANEGQQYGAVIQEALIYELESGNFGSADRYAFAQAMLADQKTLDDWWEDQLTNYFYPFFPGAVEDQ